MSGPDRDPDLDQALAYLSVAIGGVMLEHADAAVSPPTDGDYTTLAHRLAQAGRDIVLLSEAMGILVRRS